MTQEYAKYLLNKTREDYNRIADEFSRTRMFVWKELNYLANFVEDGDRVLDIGCGNGRLVEIFKDKKIEYVGIDNSEKLIGLAKEYQSYDRLGIEPYQVAEGQAFEKIKSVQFLIGDALNLPFEDNSFDKVFSVAVLHHIPSNILRLRFLSEARRVLRSGGLAVLTVWGLWGRLATWKFLFKHLLSKPLGKSKLDFGDLFIPWQKKLDRYFHAFTKAELRRLVEKAGFKIKEIGVLKREESENRNIYLIAEKPIYGSETSIDLE